MADSSMAVTASRRDVLMVRMGRPAVANVVRAI
jgi:hypothetical protein